MNQLTTLLVSVTLASLCIISCKQGPGGQSATAALEAWQDCATSGILEHSSNPQIVELTAGMVSFRSSLSQELLDKGSACLDSKRFYLWHNTPANNRGKRDGITLGDLDEAQKTQFQSLLQLFLSTDGYQKVHEITVLSEGWLKNIKSEIWNPDFYSIDMFGDPSKHGSWGFQLDGHHCVVNFLVHGDNVSIVPAFLGGEPAKETFEGQDFDIFKDERDMALALYGDMSEEEKAVAVTSSSKRALQVGAADRPGNTDPYIGDYDYSIFKTGLKYIDMSPETQAHLSSLMKEYVYNLNHFFADRWWSDITDHMDDTYFVWIDDVATPTSTSQFYYRIYNPYLWVEFNTEDVTGANARNMAEWNHIHTITRIPNNPSSDNGGDYGIFAAIINQDGPKTLHDHYATAEHHQSSDISFDYDVHHHHGDHSHTH